MTDYVYDLDPQNHNYTNFMHIFKTYGVPCKIVEVGAYAGATTTKLINVIGPIIDNLEYVVIDPYSTSLDIKEDLEKIHRVFLDRVNGSPFGRCVKLYRETSFDGLIRLRNEGFKAQLIYIDGDHTASTVLSDLVLSFDILEKGGVIVCDDVGTWKYNSDPQMSPKMAVDNFLMCNWSKLNIIELPVAHNQIAFIKL